jgi:hypothetical protein
MTTALMPPEGSGLVGHDLAALATGEVLGPEPTLGRRSDDEYLLYREAVHWLSGEPGCGKTWLALELVLEVLQDGGRAVIVDYEGTPSTTAARLVVLGAEAAALVGVTYLSPAGSLQPTALAWLSKLVADHAVPLVLIDSCAEALAAEGLSEDAAIDVTSWVGTVPRPLARAGAAVLVIDHVVKAEGGRGRWARGSGAKLAVTDVAFLLEASEPFSRDRAGRAILRVAKDRHGAIGGPNETVAAVHFEVAGGSLHSVHLDRPLQVLEAATTPSDVAQRLSASGGDWDSQRAAARALGLSTDEVGRVLDRAVQLGEIIRVERSNPLRMAYHLPELTLGPAGSCSECGAPPRTRVGFGWIGGCEHQPDEARDEERG